MGNHRPVHDPHPNAVLRGGRGNGLRKQVGASLDLPWFIGFDDGWVAIYDPTENWDDEYPDLRVYKPREAHDGA
jgi:hypothetical protein